MIFSQKDEELLRKKRIDIKLNYSMINSDQQ